MFAIDALLSNTSLQNEKWDIFDVIIREIQWKQLANPKDTPKEL